jgi:hypothetical protein
VAGRITTNDWDLYDTRHVVYRPARLSPEALKAGYDRAYRDFYTWRNVARASLAHDSVKHRAKHFFYAAGWKKFEPLWDMVIRAKRLAIMTPLLEGVLSKVTALKEREPRLDEGRSPRTGPTLPLLLTTRGIDAGERQ